MKKFDWKKVLILGFALLLCFALVACGKKDPPKPKDENVSAGTFLNTLIGGVTNIIDTLGTESDVRHIDATLIVKVGEGANELGKDANLAIRIAGNFTAEIEKNEVLVEVKNMNENGKILFGIYEHANKIYFQESVTSADRSVQKLALTGVAKLNMQTYLAKLPQILKDALSSFNLGAVLSESLVNSIAGGLGKVLPAIKKTDTGYSAVLDVEGLNGFLGDLKGLLGSVLVQYRDIINVILPDVLGVTIDKDGVVQKAGSTYPAISINVDIDENSKFNGLTFDYAWPKEGDSGNDVKVHVGLSDIKINTTSETVTAGMASEFANYAEGALKARVELNVPGLTDAGFQVNGDLYLQPGVDDVNGTVEAGNSAVKLKLVATAPDGTAYPLKAEYKYVDSGTVSGREGRIYFDIEEVARLAGIYQEGTNYRFYEKFDVAALLVGLANPTQKAFALDGNNVLPSGYTGTAYFKLQHNWQYYQKYNWVDEVNPLWCDVSIKNQADEAVGTTGKKGYDWGRDEFFVEFELSLKENNVTVVRRYRASVSQANMLAAMSDGTEEVTGIKATVTELQKEADPNLKYYDINDAVSTDASIGNRFAFHFSVIGDDGAVLPKTYIFQAATTGEGKEKAINLTQEIGKRLTKEGGIFDIIKNDIAASIPKGFDCELRIVYKYGLNQYGLMAIDALKALSDQTFGQLQISGGRDAGLLSIKDDLNKTYAADISVILKRNETVTTDAIVNELKNEKDQDGNYTGAYETYLALQQYAYGEAQENKEGAAKLPETMKYDIEVFHPTEGRPEFNFNINAVGKFLQDVLLPKIGGLKNGLLDVTLDDAKAILGMGEYLRTPDLFAAQIRMLLTNEKNSAAYNTWSVTTPYKLPTRANVSEIDLTAQKSAIGDVKELNKKYNAKLKEDLYFEILYKEFGNLTKEQLLDSGNSGWTEAQTNEYSAFVTGAEGSQTPDLQKRTEYYFKTMFTTFEARRAAHAAAYETDRVKKETDAMNAIRGYIGGKGGLDTVTSVKDFLYKADGTGRITFRLMFGKDTPTIPGMPLSFELQVLRNDGTKDVLIASAKLGLQFIKASDIPADSIPADYWNNATWIKEDLETVTVGETTKQVAKAAKYLLQAHATFTGLMSAENPDGWTVLLP